MSQNYMLQLVRKFLPIQAKKLIYCAHLLSRINYGQIILGPMVNQANKKQNLPNTKRLHPSNI